MIYNEWQDFVLYSLLPEKVKTRSDRLNTKNAFKLQSNGCYSEEYRPSSVGGAVFDVKAATFDNDKFEAMEITDSGQVYIWTEKKVWFLTREGNNLEIEKMRYIPRNPSTLDNQ